VRFNPKRVGTSIWKKLARDSSVGKKNRTHPPRLRFSLVIKRRRERDKTREGKKWRSTSRFVNCEGETLGAKVRVARKTGRGKLVLESFFIEEGGRGTQKGGRKERGWQWKSTSTNHQEEVDSTASSSDTSRQKRCGGG